MTSRPPATYRPEHQPAGPPPAPRRDVTCCGELVVIAVVLVVCTGIAVVRWLRGRLGL